MSAQVLLNLLSEIGKSDKMRGLSSILSLFRNEFNKFTKYRSTNVRFYLSQDHQNYLKSHFGREKVKMLPSFTQRYNVRNDVTLLNL